MIDLLRCKAEAVAWPLVSPDAFRRALPILQTESLFPSFQSRLRQLGVSRAEELAQDAWTDNSSLVAHLQYHATRLLYNNGAHMRLRPDHEQPGREILAWRWFSLALPPLLLSGAAMPLGISPPNWIQVLDPSLIPRGPVAHLHLHLGAVYPFELIWSHLASTVRFDEVHDPPSGMRDVAQWRSWLTRALLARRVLSAHTYHSAPSPLETCRFCLDDSDISLALGELTRGRLNSTDRFRDTRLARFAREVTFRHRSIRHISDVWYNDPLGGTDILPEAVFMARSFSYLSRQHETGQEDQFYGSLWTQYQRLRCQLYRHIVCDSAEAGLSTFSTRYHRISEYLGSDLEVLAPNLALGEPGLALQAVEVRSAPPRNVGSCLVKARQVRECSSDSQTEMGWVFHLIRDRERGNHLIRNRAEESYSPRYARIFRSHMRSTSLLGRCIRWRPALLRSIRGLDLASEELKGPLWLAIPSLQGLREVSRVAARQQAGLQPLRLTLHVGEDFRHILSGLRAIHEPFAWHLMERGDRLGHALALGVDVAKWCEQHPTVLQPRLERILDLVWLLDFISTPGRAEVDGATLHRLHRELSLRLREWSGTDHYPGDGISLHQLLGDRTTLSRIGYPGVASAGHPPSREGLRLVWSLFYSRAHQDRADEIVEVDTEPDSSLLVQIQKSLAELLSRWQVTIEVNPSSNLLIGALDQPLDQPMFHLRPVEQHVAHALPVAINADDPITFSTRLADEYAYAWAGMVVAGGISPTYARQWLDEAAETAWRSRFTLPPPVQTVGNASVS